MWFFFPLFFSLLFFSSTDCVVVLGFFVCVSFCFPRYKQRRQNPSRGSQWLQNYPSALMFKFMTLLRTQTLSISNLRSHLNHCCWSFPPLMHFFLQSQKWKCLAALCLPWIKVTNHFFWHQRSHFQSDYFIQFTSCDLSSFSPILIDHCLILFFFLVTLKEISVKQT